MSSPDPSPPCAIVYAAKSTKDEHGSIPRQITDARQLAEREGREVVLPPYFDEAMSAYSGNRGAGLTNAKAHAERLAAEGVDVALVVQHTDRLARGDGVGADHLVELALWAKRAGVRIASVQDPTTCESGLAFAAMMGDRNYEDSRRKALSVSSGMKARVAKGMHSGSPRKYGYDYQRDAFGNTMKNAPMVQVPVEAAVILRIFRDYDAGITQNKLARTLTAEGIPTTRGGKWYQGTIANYLKSPFYAGLIDVGDGELVEGAHDGIVDRELWDRVQVVAAAGRRGVGKGGRPANAFLFTNGHLRCGQCGGAMVPRTDARASGTYEVYRCFTRASDTDACTQAPVERDAIDRAAIRELTKRGVNAEQTRAQVAASAKREHAEAQARLVAARAVETKAIARWGRIESTFADGDLAVADYTRMSARFGEELDAARAQREQAEHLVAQRDVQPDDIDAALGALTHVNEAITNFMVDTRHLDELRLRLRQVFDGFVMHDTRATGGAVALVPTLTESVLDTVMADASKRAAVRATTAYNGLQT